MEYAFRNTLTRVLLVLSVLALFTGIVWAQGGSGELTGLISDPSGAVVSGAEVKLKNPATGDVRTTTSSQEGIYRFAALPVGTYSIEVAPKGFKSLKVQNVVVTVGTTATADVKLELGATSEQVTVEAGAQLVQTEDAALSQLIDRRVWENMPLEARNPNDFINLVAGAVPEQIAGGTFRGAAVNGTRTGTGNFLVEGVDNNEQGQGGVAICGTACGQGGANTSISPDAIQEYRVITHGFAAEYGKAGGFVTDTVLKSGTNQWHGSLFEYNRIQKLTANDWFSNNGDVRDHLVRNQFGGTIGGPIYKDKTFFFLNAEIHKLRVSAPINGTTMTQQFYDFVNSGQFADYINNSPNFFCGGECTDLPTSVGPIFQSQLQKFPQSMPLVNSNVVCDTTLSPDENPGDCVGQGAYTTGLVFPVPVYGSATESQTTPVDQYRVAFKFDHKFGDHDQFNGTYLFEDTHFSCNNCGSDTTFGVPEDNPNRAQTLGLAWTHTFSPTVLNQFKAGYSRRKANFFAPGSEGTPSIYTIDALVSGFGGSQSIPQLFTENQFQYKDDISITKGRNSLKFGGEYRRTRNGSSFQADRYGHFGYWSAEDMITDGVFTDSLDNSFGYGANGYGGFYYAGAAIDPTTGQLPDFYRGYRSNEVAFYGQDDMRINSRLTLNVGLRWEYFGPPHNFKKGIDSNFFFGTPVVPIRSSSNPFFPGDNPYYALEASAVPQVRDTSIWNKDTNNFAPRFGFSYDTMGNQKLVVRGSFGIFYDRMYNNVFENIRFNPPFYADELAGVFASGTALGPLKQPGLLTIPFTSNAQFINPDLFPNGLPKPVPRHIDQNLVNAYYEQYSLGVQHEISKDFALEANFVGTLGRKLIGILNRNTYNGRTACTVPLRQVCIDAGFDEGFSSSRPNLIFNNDNARGNYYGSNYNALALTLRKRFSHGLNFNANYTYAKALDELSDVFRAKNGQISATDVQNIRFDYGPADFDVRHRVVFSYNYDLPFFTGNRWIGGWALNGIFSWNTGSPVALFDSRRDPNRNGILSDRPSFVGSGSVPDSIIGNVQFNNETGHNQYTWFDASQFSPTTCPTSVNQGLWCNGNLGRGALAGPSFTNLDFGISKGFKVTESTKLRFDANFFNIFNHPNFKNPQGNFSDTNFGNSEATYGDTGGHRVTQLALRFEF